MVRVTLLDVSLGETPMALWVLEKKDRVVVEQDEATGCLHGPRGVCIHTYSRGGAVKILLISWTKSTLSR